MEYFPITSNNYVVNTSSDMYDDEKRQNQLNNTYFCNFFKTEAHELDYLFESEETEYFD